MSREIIFAPEARLEFEDAVIWYDAQEPGLGDRFEAAVDATIADIVRKPERFQRISRKIHKARVAVFEKYSVYFRLEPEFIGVVSVFHGARNPAKLRRRLR